MNLSSEVAAREWLAAGHDRGAIERLEAFARLLAEENRHQNLVSARSLETIWLRHFADSAQLLEFVPRETLGVPWFDLGSGAGFPGLVVAILRPQLTVELVESRAKRVDWLHRATIALELSNVKILGSRLESILSAPKSVISARAFAPLAQLIALSARFSTPQTLWLLPKGRSARQELAAMPKSIQSMFHVEQSLTNADAAILLGSGVPRLKEPHR